MSYYEEGMNAVFTCARYECPYAEGTDACIDWLMGYDNALYTLYRR